MATNFKVREAQQVANGTVLGTVESVGGPGAKYGFRDTNLANNDKRVVLTIKRADGTEDDFTCSAPVSEGIRNKEITLAHLKGFEIKEQVSSAGELYNQINMPSKQGKMVWFDADDIKAETFAVESLSEDKIKNLLAVSL